MEITSISYLNANFESSLSKRSGASQAADLSHSLLHRVFQRAPSKLFPKFLLTAERVVNGYIVSGLDDDSGLPAHMREDDARSLPLGDGSVDIVLMFPPCLNTIDYIWCSKFSLVWMDHTVGEMRRLWSDGIGTNVGKYEYDESTRRTLSETDP